MKVKRALFLLFLLFCIAYYIARLAVFVATITGSITLEHEVSPFAEAIVRYSFLAIGVIGFALLAGVASHRSWGLWGTVVLSAYTIVWDSWAAIWVQSSAAIGIVPAVIIMGYLVLYRKDFHGKGPPPKPEAPPSE